MSDVIPATILDRAIDGVSLRGRTLREELAGETDATLLVFLRHLG